MFAGCLGLGPADIASCQESGRARCQQGLDDTTCWDRQVSALEDCAGYAPLGAPPADCPLGRLGDRAGVADATCEALCDGDSCEHQCEWTCPQAAPDGS